ncbi:MAG: ATP-dependent Clp protease ATP-binding subunit [Patescibacteria group bacterium]
MTNPLPQIHFYDSRLKMNAFSRFLARLIINSFYAILIFSALVFVFITSEIKPLFYAGLLLSLFLLDRLIHIKEADRSILGFTRYLPRIERRKIDFSQENINTAQFLTPSSFSLLERACDKAMLLGGDFYLYLLKLLVHQSDIKKALIKMDVPVSELENKIDEFINSEENKKIRAAKEECFEKAGLISKLAFDEAVYVQNQFISPESLFVALRTVDNPFIQRILKMFDINPDDLPNAMIFSHYAGYLSFWRRLPVNLSSFINQPKRIRHRVMNRAWTARPTPTLDAYGVDFTDLAREKQIGFLIGHKQEYDRLVNTLSRVIKPNALLIGEPGSGKETIVAALAFGIIKDEIPKALFDKRLIALSISNLIAGAPPEEITGRLNRIIEEIISSGNIILYIPDIHNLIKTSPNNGFNAADILMPIISHDSIPIIGATYPKEFKQYIESLNDFKDAFEIIRVEEISEDEAVKLLTFDSLLLEKKYRITITFGAIKSAVSISHKHFRDKLLPSSAEELLKETLSYVENSGNKILKANDVISVAERKINIPLRHASEAETKNLLNLEKIIHESFINQETAVSAVSRALREYRSGLSRGKGPIAAFLFVGPTGVGKTELSKNLSKIQFGSEESMVRFDMSEYQTRESIYRFIGSPDGQTSGQLTECISQKPYSLILLDEFEKAHPDILNLFLQVFDDGRLTDNFGKIVDFSNTIIIATSNANSELIKEMIEAKESMPKISETIKKKLTVYFKPELLNRLSQIVVFKNLSIRDIEEIAKLQLIALTKTLEATHGISLVFNDAAICKIAALGYDPVFGARPLRGVISEKIKSVLAEKILRQEIAKGNAIDITLENEEIAFKIK